MKVILYAAISIDGYIAKLDDNTDWVCDTDWGVFSKMVKDVGCIVMGRKTYEVSGEDFPYDCKLNIVLTSDSGLKSESENVLFTNADLKEVIRLVEEKGFNEVLIIGGGQANGSFLESGLVDEIYLSVHPIVLGKGIKIFNMNEQEVNLELLDINKLEEDLVHLHYRVKK